MPPVSIVIPHWNRRQLLERLLKQLREQTCPIAEVIVVDNGSTDGSQELAEGLGARIVRNATNLGFAKAVNQGVQASRTPLVAVLNNDVTLERDWLEKLVEATPSDAAFSTGKILVASSPGNIDGTYDLLSRSGCAWRAGNGQPDAPAWNAAREIQFAPFTAVLLRKDAFERVGGLDEGFGSYLEDVDFGLRCAEAGLSGRYVPAAVAYHDGSQTLGAWSAESVRLISRNQVLLIARHYSRKLFFRYVWNIVAGQLLWGFLAARHGAIGAWLQGKWQGVKALATRSNPASHRLEIVLEKSEAEIRRLAMDRYWRWYSALT